MIDLPRACHSPSGQLVALSGGVEVLDPDETEALAESLRADSCASPRPRWYQGRHDDDARQANGLGPS